MTWVLFSPMFVFASVTSAPGHVHFALVPRSDAQTKTTGIAATLKSTTIKESVQRATEQKAVQDRYTARDDKRRTMCDTPTPLLQKTSDGIEKNHSADPALAALHQRMA